MHEIDVASLFWVKPHISSGTNQHIALTYIPRCDQDLTGYAKTLCMDSMQCNSNPFSHTWDKESPSLLCSKCLRRVGHYIRMGQIDRLHTASKMLHEMFPIE